MFRVIETATGASEIVGALSEVYGLARAIAESEGLDSVAPIAGTYVVAYHSGRRCGGHEIARVHETERPR